MQSGVRFHQGYDRLGPESGRSRSWLGTTAYDPKRTLPIPGSVQLPFEESCRFDALVVDSAMTLVKILLTIATPTPSPISYCRNSLSTKTRGAAPDPFASPFE